MKGRVAVLDRIGACKAAALVVDGELDDLLVEPEDGRFPPGTILRGIAGRPMKGQGGILLSLPEGQTAFLKQGRGIRPGEGVLVQVTGYAEAGKAVPVTGRLLFKSRYAIVTPGAPGRNLSRRIRDSLARDALNELAAAASLPEGAGLIMRAAAAAAESSAVDEDIAAMAGLAREILAESPDSGPELLLRGPDPHALAKREWQVDEVENGDGAFARQGVLEAIDALRTPRVELPGGASMLIEPTRALVAVDVNTGPDGSPAAGLRANISAARNLPRHLRCRGLGGQITVDFAPAPKRDRRQIEAALTAALRTDPIETALAGWTPLGHFEMQRKRDRLPLSEIKS